MNQNERMEISSYTPVNSVKGASTLLVQAKCTNCSANLEVDRSKDAAICPYCGAAYIVEKAINNYNVSNNITAGVVNIYGDSSSDFEIVGGILQKYKGASTNVVIPNNVSIIGNDSFKNCRGIVSVSIPNSVVQIEPCAFVDCSNLQKVNIPDSVRGIGPSAFSRCNNLKTISIPNTDIDIDPFAFNGCEGLKISWPEKWANKQLSRLKIAAGQEISGNVHIYQRNDIVPTREMTLIYVGPSNSNWRGYDSYARYALFEMQSYLKEPPHSGFVNIISDLQQKYEELSLILDRAGINRSTIETVVIPGFTLKYSKLSKKTSSVRTTGKALQLKLINE